ncbi:N-acetylglucosamine-6-phosphate deacetylase [Desertivibrio insolitus]|uniref:N-acetylglucosamine-6-phosphate deacetylase n=1 Tax=Herbiconiux sp. SYSU D00978 TaxID=2812562 RepID=UPI0027DCCE5A|nr:N-acetylglucosamine-6-phosphate deacetylase [Herbiconiux sp. SYSU D00978]
MSTLFHGARKLDADGIVDDFWMLVDRGTITATGSGDERPDASERVDLAGDTLTPGFVDLHGHGGAGASVDDGTDAIRAGLAVHRSHGTTRSVISLVTNPLPDLERSLAAVAEFAAEDPLVLGSHLEGPWLAPARKGAHSPEHLVPPTTGAAEALLAAARGTLRQVTVAPELPGALDVIRLLVDAGVAVAVGHTEADAATARSAFDAGATLLTHAYNAMPGIHHRAPGPVVAALRDERVTLELVLDGIHVDPELAAVTLAAAPGRVALITDAMAAAGAHDGRYRLGSADVVVDSGRATIAGTDTIAGSTLTQDAALRLALASGIDPVAAVTALTLTPARALGEKLGLLAVDYPADAVRLDTDWTVRAVWGAGERLA